MAELTDANTLETKADAGKSPEEQVRLWVKQVKLAQSEESEWRKEVASYENRYASEKDDNDKFNIFYSNTQTIQPNLYNNQPVPDVRRKHGDTDPIGKEAAQVLERGIDTALDDYDFDEAGEMAVLEHLITGRGVARVRHVRYTGMDESQPEVVYESSRCEFVHWRDFTRGPGRVWSDVPWVCYTHYLTKEQLQELNPALADEVPLDATSAAKDDDEDSNEEAQVLKRALVWEIWNKDDRQVLWIAPGYDEDFLRVDEDPYGLVGFYDMPKPLYSVPKPGSLVPIPEFRFYKEQADELNELTRRIKKITKAIQAKGFYNAAMGDDFAELFEEGDTMLLPLNGAAMSERPIENAVGWIPIEKLVQVLRELQAQREQVKAVIYEITGISDILRGSSNPDETARAQAIKSQYGGLRLNKRQRAVQKFMRDIIRIKAEIIAEKYQPRTLALIMGQEVRQEVIDRLKNDISRTFTIDIETDSTIAGDIQRAQENMGNFMQGMAAFLQAIGPAVEGGMVSKEQAVTLFKSFARTYRLGKEAENVLEELGSADSPEAMIQKLQQQLQQAGQQLQATQQELQKVNQAETQAKVSKAETDRMKVESEASAQLREYEIKMADLQLRIRAAEQKDRELDQADRELALKAKEIALKASHDTAQLMNQRRERDSDDDREEAA